jgi:hypothetical protein
MTEDQFKTLALFSAQLGEMRESYNNEQLLDWCEVVLGACVVVLRDAPFDPPPKSKGGDSQEPPVLTIGQQMTLLTEAISQPPTTT